VTQECFQLAPGSAAYGKKTANGGKEGLPSKKNAAGHNQKHLGGEKEEENETNYFSMKNVKRHDKIRKHSDVADRFGARTSCAEYRRGGRNQGMIRC